MGRPGYLPAKPVREHWRMGTVAFVVRRKSVTAPGASGFDTQLSFQFLRCEGWQSSVNAVQARKELRMKHTRERARWACGWRIPAAVLASLPAFAAGGTD